MTYYDDIYEFAVDNHYLVSTAEANELGVPSVELAKLAHRGKLENLARGLYRLARYVPSDSDPYAIAVARAGSGAYLYGESVLALLNLAPTNPSRIWVATPRRVRLKEPIEGVSFVSAGKGDAKTVYEGILCQTVACAIEACAGRMMPDRLAQAAKSAREQGYLTSSELKALQEKGVLG